MFEKSCAQKFERLKMLGKNEKFVDPKIDPLDKI